MLCVDVNYRIFASRYNFPRQIMPCALIKLQAMLEQITDSIGFNQNFMIIEYPHYTV